ncbi:c-type cytochrome [Luteolibacter ambystomatis]|uniref:C-type cytochrome n=1 Tax=Luteolibacter ambystomatis TaxID=2824561 RepID=A0A975IZY7_9BACT|nr:c-type cytochrome [Luteolibacter ambystomatis]QUE50835.1 c-type cytochrome [Luteolibacter ambystomatis]
MRPASALLLTLSAPAAMAVPDGFTVRDFAGPPQVEYPTAATAAANGDVYISSDKNGSLGHKPNFGKIVRATDTDGDGKADKFQDFVPDVNSPRGGHFVNGTLYLIHPPYLTSYRDTNGDGVADEEKELVKGFGWGIEHPRGADHTTNGVRMGIDGWLYVAVGDFGMPDAVAADGKHLTLHGGGVVRIRPDGSEMEPYAVMTRNICDVAISPYLDLFSRDNTNDGKGWNTRFHHFTELGNHGYPRLYQHFADEAIKPLADYGGGSGTGALYLHEPGFPKDFGDSVFTCDWTVGAIFRHPMKPFEASFVAKQEVFEKYPHAIDIDVDGFSRLYMVDWRNGGFDFNGKEVGMIHQAIAPGEKPAKYVDVTKAKDEELPALVASRSAVQRLEAQREIIKRGQKPVFANGVFGIAKDPKQELYARVAAIFTFKQLYGKGATKPLSELVADASVKEFVLRAMTDRLSELDGVPVQPYVEALKDPNARTRLQALIGLARLGAKDAAPAILAAAGTWPTDESKLEEGAHYRLPHTAVKSLAQIGNAKACLAAIAAPASRPIALRALQEMHTDEVVDGLIRIADGSKDPAIVTGALGALARLYNDEKPWNLKDWWNTRPDDRGPYFEPVTWSATPKIKQAIERNFTKIPPTGTQAYIQLLAVNRIQVSDLKLGDLDPLVVALGSTNPDASQIQILLAAAKDAKRPWEQRSSAYQSLMRAGDQASTLRLAVLSTWATENPAPAAASQLEADFVNESQRGMEVPKLRELGAKQSDAASRIAWKALLTVLNSPLAKANAKEQVKKFINENPREVGFFLAIKDLKLSGFDKQIDAGIHSDNELTIAAAKAAKEAGASSAAQGGGKKIAELKHDDVVKAAMTGKGDVATGKRLFTSQGCIACHSTDPNAEQKGPYLGAAGAKFTRDYLIDSVLEPSKVVAQGFQTTMFQMKDGTAKVGFVTAEADGVIEMRDIAGQIAKIKRDDVKDEQHMKDSMMPPGLAAGLTMEEFTALIEYLASLKAVGG